MDCGTNGICCGSQPTETEPADTPLRPVVDFESLQAINPDVVAWICMEDTVINYPVVLGRDNSKYLYKMVDGTTNAAGSIFMDYRNLPDFTDRNTILYGHHMKNKTMFAPIINYKEQAFYDEHPNCLILTPEGKYTLEFFAGFVANLNGDAWKLKFASDEEYAAWLEKAAASSTFESAVTPTPEDRVVTHPSSVKVTLYCDGVAYDTVTLSAANNWKYIWEDLTDEFEWEVDEPSVPSGYTKTGDSNDLLGLGALGIVGVIGFVCTAFLLFVPRKKGKYER